MSKLPSVQRMQSSLVQTPLFSPFRKGRRNAIQSTADPEGRRCENVCRSGFWTPHHPVTSLSDRLSGGEIIWDRRAVVGRVDTQAKNSVRHYTGHAVGMPATNKAISQEGECCYTEYHIITKPVHNSTCWFGQGLIKSFSKYVWVQMTLS